MRSPATRDEIDDLLADLTPLEPNPSRVESFRRDCRAQLARRAATLRRPGVGRESWTRVTVPVLLGIFSAFYAVELFVTTLRVAGWLE